MRTSDAFVYLLCYILSLFLLRKISDDIKKRCPYNKPPCRDSNIILSVRIFLKTLYFILYLGIVSLLIMVLYRIIRKRSVYIRQNFPVGREVLLGIIIAVLITISIALPEDLKKLDSIKKNTTN